MMTQLIKLTGDTVTLLSNTPKNIGTEIDLKLRLPKGTLLKCFTLSGSIIRCQPVTVSDDKSPGYVLEVKLGDISPMNKNILDAYVDFIERRNMLKGIKVDFKALEDVMSDFGEKLTQLRKTSELLRNNVQGTLPFTKSGKKHNAKLTFRRHQMVRMVFDSIRVFCRGGRPIRRPFASKEGI